MLASNYLGHLGRLGNQMFQYASLRGIAAARGYDFGIPPSNFDDEWRTHQLFEVFELPHLPKQNIKYLDGGKLAVAIGRAERIKMDSRSEGLAARVHFIPGGARGGWSGSSVPCRTLSDPVEPPKVGPRSVQSRAKVVPKSAQIGPKVASKSPQSQPNVGPKSAQGVPFGTQVAPKSRPKTGQEKKRRLQGTILLAIFVAHILFQDSPFDFGLIFD